MTQQPGDGGEKKEPSHRLSDLNKDKGQRSMQIGGIRQYTTIIGVVVIVVLLAIIALKVLQTPQQVASVPTNTPVEVGTIQALETSNAQLITPSLDPNMAALQTQNAQLAQNLTNQAATSQAQAQIVPPTQLPTVVVPPTQPPVTVIAPTAVVQIITATPQPQAQPTQVVRIITATPQPQEPTQVVQPNISAPQNSDAVQTIQNCPMYEDTGKGGQKILNIDVPAGEIAFIDAYAFDTTNGGVLVTIIGEYHGTHTIRDGAYCWGIKATDNYQPVLNQRRSQLSPNFTEISLPTRSDQSCLPKSDFVAIVNKWHNVDKSAPKPAIDELDARFEQGASSGAWIGEQWATAPNTIKMGQSGSVVFWTNTFNKPFNKIMASGVIEKIFLTGGYGIYAAWDTDVNVPTPGRSAWLCERLDPANDFPWWGK